MKDSVWGLAAMFVWFTVITMIATMLCSCSTPHHTTAFPGSHGVKNTCPAYSDCMDSEVNFEMNQTGK